MAKKKTRKLVKGGRLPDFLKSNTRIEREKFENLINTASSYENVVFELKNKCGLIYDSYRSHDSQDEEYYEEYSEEHCKYTDIEYDPKKVLEPISNYLKNYSSFKNIELDTKIAGLLSKFNLFFVETKENQVAPGVNIIPVLGNKYPDYMYLNREGVFKMVPSIPWEFYDFKTEFINICGLLLKNYSNFSNELNAFSNEAEKTNTVDRAVDRATALKSEAVSASAAIPSATKNADLSSVAVSDVDVAAELNSVRAPSLSYCGRRGISPPMRCI